MKNVVPVLFDLGPGEESECSVNWSCLFHAPGSRLARKIRRRPKLARPRRRKVVFEALEPRILLSVDLSLISAETGLSAFLDDFQTQLNEQVLSAPIPLVGGQRADEGSAGQIATKINLALADKLPTGEDVKIADVESALAGALVDLLDPNGGISILGNDGDSEIRFDLDLGFFYPSYRTGRSCCRHQARIYSLTALTARL